MARRWQTVSRLAPTLVTRIRFNYKPKHVALLGPDLTAILIEVLEQAGLASLFCWTTASL